MEAPWADLTRVRWQLREMQAADRAFREDTGLRLQDISTTADSQLTEAGWMKASFEAVQYNCNRAEADAALARATLATEREKHEEELERRVNAWSVRMAEQLEEVRENEFRSEIRFGKSHVCGNEL
jgi:hypothetical protein